MSEKIHYSELVERIAKKSSSSKTLIHDLLKETVKAVNTNLADKGESHLSGFGKFHLEWSKARQGRNPQTGESMEIPAHNRILFKPEAGVRRFINRDYEHLKPIFLDDDIEEKNRDSATLISNLEPEKTSSEGSKKKNLWLWLLPLILIIFLFWLFWPVADDSTELMIEETIVKVNDKNETIIEDIIVVEETDGKNVKIDAVIVKETVIRKTGTAGGTYSVSAGDNLWGISVSFYGNEYLWPNIYKENMGKIKNPDILTTGLKISVPSLEGANGSLTSNDLESIAEGYMQIYFTYRKSGNEKAVYYLWAAKKASLPVYNKYIDNIDPSDSEAIGAINGRLQF